MFVVSENVKKSLSESNKFTDEMLTILKNIAVKISVIFPKKKSKGTIMHTNTKTIVF